MRTSTVRRTGAGRRRRTGLRVAAVVGATIAGGLLVLGAASPRAPTLATAVSREPARAGASGAPGQDALVELGRRLFFDPGASHSRTKSCASCHDPAHGWSDPKPKSADDFGETRRHSQTVLNLPSTSPLHWDGEFDTLEDLVYSRTGDRRTGSGGYGRNAEEPFAVTPVAALLAVDGLYARAFAAAFGDPTPTRERLASAIAAFVRTLASTTSAYDRYAAGDATALSDSAVRGLDLFRGRAGCAQCHTMEEAGATFTDGRFHNTGVGLVQDTGRQTLTKSETDARAFKTPSLRDVAQRAPYMHDGSLGDLKDVVRYYAVGCGNAAANRRGVVADPTLDSKISPFDAGVPSAVMHRDVADLVAFLGALSSETRPGLATSAWSARATRTRLRLVWDTGAPYRRTVEIEPAGDVVPVAAAGSTAPIELVPDAYGWIEFTPFATTHAAIRIIGGSRPRSGEFVPDTCDEATLTVLSSSDFGRDEPTLDEEELPEESTIRVQVR